jgi:DNA repair protein RecN (Recombination protein N)
VLGELRVSDLGVIDDLAVVLGPGMTAVTGETGAGKTLLVDAIELLLGATADPVLVRPGATEAVVEGRFVRDGAGGEVVLTRVVPAAGRSRAYVDGRMVAAAQLAEIGTALVDLHGQHAHQSLLSPSAQTAALDAAAGLSGDRVGKARRVVRAIAAEQQAMGGDARTRARELDLLGYQLDEIEAAALDDPGEEDALRAEEELLADASGLREAAGGAWEALAGDDGVVDRLGAVVAGLAGRSPLAALEGRLRAAGSELSDVAREARSLAEGVQDDPERLAAIGARRQRLADLRRKYGEDLQAVIAYREETRRRVEDLRSHDRKVAQLEQSRAAAARELTAAEEELWLARRAGAPVLAGRVEARLQELAMPRARFSVDVGPDPGREKVTWLLGANPGEPLLPLAKVASGGELARTMLAVRLALGTAAGAGGPSTLVFDEVDAGVGGEAALAVGRALADLATASQVLVVTHLPQVAAFADRQLVVSKSEAGGRTVAQVRPVDGQERIVELSRMLSGSPDSETARRHAEELLSRAASR